jgi:hypothetical protein
MIDGKPIEEPGEIFQIHTTDPLIDDSVSLPQRIGISLLYDQIDAGQ